MLQKLGFAPGFNKQVTETGAEGQWFDGDNVRFRYGTPEKIGGWSQLGQDNLTGMTSAIHHWENNNSIKYAALGTNKILYVFAGGTYYDIHPIRETLTGVNFTSTSSSNLVTITCTGAHGLLQEDIVLFESVSGLSGSTFTNASFENNKFMVTAVPSATTFTITMTTTEVGTPVTNAGSSSVLCYFTVGPAIQVGGFGWSAGNYGGTVTGEATSTLAVALTDTTTTNIVLASTAAFPDAGEIRIGTEDISYTTNNKSTNTLSGGARGVNGTTKATHSGGVTVTNITDFTAWGEEASFADFNISPGLWVLDNFGQKLIALIYNGACFEWDGAPSNATDTRATILANAPTASRHVLVSTPDRHLVFFGTETTIGDSTTQDDMFIRFSDQENISGTDAYTVRAENTAGTQRLADGSRIMGAIKGRDAIYVWTDTALFLMQFVGQPFTFAFQQVGTNCGLLGKNACKEVDGSAYWMSENGFFNYDGQLRTLPSLVEDYVYSTDAGPGINLIARDLVNCGLNNLFGEITWFYCSNSSQVVDRMVTYNYLDSSTKQPIWTIGSLARTAWQDSAVFDKPHATYYTPTDNNSFDVIGNTDGTSIYYEHEKGTDEVNAGGVVTAIQANILSGDFDITQRRSNTGQVVGTPDLRGDGEYIMRISRFLPDFIEQIGNTKVSFTTRAYPNSTPVTTNFDTTSSTTFKSTRIRARSIALKVSNTSIGQNWKLGTFRLDIAPGGMR
tara:strand:- start:186 stop:2381 length:2196 start_codon:yes stop_codon:yes gene_type:complete